MTGIVRYEPMIPEDKGEALSLVQSVFDAHVAPHFSEEGRTTFHEFVRQFAFSDQPGKTFALVARRERTIIGVIEVVDGSHVALLFVAPEFQRHGVGSELVQRAITECLRRMPPPDVLTVNASPNALAAYARMGFVPMKQEQERDGIRHVPMALVLNAPDQPEHPPPLDEKTKNGVTLKSMNPSISYNYFCGRGWRNVKRPDS